jgi:hypothetical protein
MKKYEVIACLKNKNSFISAFEIKFIIFVDCNSDDTPENVALIMLDSVLNTNAEVIIIDIKEQYNQ